MTEFTRLVAEVVSGVEPSVLPSVPALLRLYGMSTWGFGTPTAETAERHFRLWLGLEGLSEAVCSGCGSTEVAYQNNEGKLFCPPCSEKD
jgi:uncharacterized Zn-finger protein